MAIDALEYLEQAATPASKPTGTFAPFFFAINDGEKALIRPLINLTVPGEDGTLQVGVIEVYKHEYYDNTNKKWVYRNLCPSKTQIAFGDDDCSICAEVAQMPTNTKEEKSLKHKCEATRRFVLPVYLHTVVNDKTRQVVTYTNQANETLPVSGVRLLEMKPDYSTIFRDLLKTYQASESHDITKRDFKIERSTGSNGFPVYDTTPKDISPFTADVEPEYLDRDLVFSLYMEACPPKRVGESTVTPASASKGAVAAAPDF